MTYAPEYNMANAWRMVMHCDCGRLFDDPSEWTQHQLKGEVNNYWSSGLECFESYDGYYGDYGDPYDDYYYDDEFEEENPLMTYPDDGEDEPDPTEWYVIAQAKHQQGKVRRSRQRKDTLGKYRGDDAAKAQPPCYRKDRHQVIGKPRRHLSKAERRIANRKMRKAVRQGC